ncbi:MAG TPA: nicotinate-nucleotide--dimethylbenzimidazole phosphoribosyltransferase [Clostridia bacterium]|nr:MAG: Nicotinate-nucleotide--dimethylbenzimidazole phosphoribosyltransferase [Firmicutes bacterium ADurb.Bin248]HOG01349.1 nicotinate-nucleotide--dimethylbenzimidazole phosphoribosyltransferase [Clostridia bacterium]HOS18826.1 nicotinate-nucleotide--dimethylbenzimidazole phosphoribosyltransferase [Clostridia bacterium]HPK14567.1 nicotinate-nucleotide--dimethylbenzimidazole phosphoribosyltransferase [Clostridia bacterium]
MIDFTELNARIKPPDEAVMRASRARWDSLAKPLRSLGALEDDVVRIAGVQGALMPDVSRRAVAVMCADNGVVARGVTQTGQEVTAVVAESIARGASSVCRMARVAGAEVYPVDVGVARPVDIPALWQRNVRRGTADMTKGPAMERGEASAAVEAGMEVVRILRDEGYRLVATGEMGIGNTTTSSAVMAALTGRPVEEVTGRGAGLSDEGLLRKQGAVAAALKINRPDASDALDVLHKVGGLDIAGIAGLCIGGALYRVPVLLDGVISLVAALAAAKLCPACGAYLIASHVSKEPAAGLLIKELGLAPLICAGMGLGEGTGAVAAMPLLDMALAVYRETATFEDIRVPAYKPPC